MDRLLDESKNHAEHLKDIRTVKYLSQCIGDRREKDLVDELLKQEVSNEWHKSVSLLVEAISSHYQVPPSFGKAKMNIEPLKIREVIFSIFDCGGMEPVNLRLSSLLDLSKNCDSFIESKKAIKTAIHNSSISQLELGDSLFFNYEYFQDSLRKKAEAIRRKQIDNYSISFDGEKYDVSSLWYTEYGRQGLIETGVRGFFATHDEIMDVLQVLQLLLQEEVHFNFVDVSTLSRNESAFPSHPLYTELLESMIMHDLERIQALGSSLGIGIISYNTRAMYSEYQNNQSSHIYRMLLGMIQYHVRIRSIESISILEELINSTSPRIADPAISALGNFYHPSSAGALIEYICKTKDKFLLSSAYSALKNLQTRTPEIDYIIQFSLDNCDCDNLHLLRKIRDKHDL